MGCLLGCFMVGLMATSSKRHDATCYSSQECWSQSPCHCNRLLLTCACTGDTQTLKGRSGSVSVGSLGPGMYKVLFEPSEHLWQVWGLILNVISPFISSCWGFSFALGDGVSLFGGIQHSPVDWYSAASCIFGVLSGEDERVYSVILSRNVCVYLHLWSQSAEYTQDGFIARGVLWFLPDMEGGKNRIEKGRTWA